MDDRLDDRPGVGGGIERVASIGGVGKFSTNRDEELHCPRQTNIVFSATDIPDEPGFFWNRAGVRLVSSSCFFLTIFVSVPESCVRGVARCVWHRYGTGVAALQRGKYTTAHP